MNINDKIVKKELKELHQFRLELCERVYRYTFDIKFIENNLDKFSWIMCMNLDDLIHLEYELDYHDSEVWDWA